MGMPAGLISSPSKGSIYFDLEEMNRLRVYLAHETIPSVTGFHDVLVTEDGCEVLSQDIPREVDAIEALMRR